MIGNTFYFQWEIMVAQWLQSFESGFVTSLAKFFTLLGEEYLMILILGTIYWCVNKELGRKVALAVSGSMIFGSLLKGAVLRRRPYMDNESIKCIRAPHSDGDLMSPLAQGFSMPSLHASMSTSVYGTIAWNVRKTAATWIAVLLPFFIGLSRVYLGVHYVTDVMAGWILGAISIFLLSAIEKKFGYKISFLVIVILGAAGFFYCRDSEFYSVYGVVVGLLIGFAFEEKFVHFEMAEKWWEYLVRPVIGVALFLVISELLKLLIAQIVPDDAETILLACRAIRYAIAIAFIIGVYPLTFKIRKKMIRTTR